MKKTLTDFQPLKPAEQELLECCQNGEEAIIGEKRPTEKTEANEIRAEFLRWLILFSKVDIDINGIRVQGAWISGKFYLNNAHCLYMLVFFESVFEEKFYLSRAVTKSVFLDGSLFQNGIEASGLMCQGNFHLRRNVDVKGESFFLGAIVEGNFDCSSASFEVLDTTQRALNCERMIIQNNVFLNKQFTAKGEVRFLGARINGDFFCSNGSFESLDEDQHALVCDGMIITGGLFLRRNYQILSGSVDLTRATVGSLIDDTNFWQQKALKTVYMDGFKYGHIHGDISASFRLENMLSKMPEFMPQPYKQLAKVLRDMGHDKDADEVMIALTDNRLELQKNEVKKASKYIFFNWLRIKRKRIFCKWFPLKRIFSNSMRILSLKISHILWKFYRLTSLYGYRPMRAFGIMIFVWLSCGLIYDYSAKRAVFAPTNPLIYKPMYQDQPQETNCTLDASGTPWFASAEDYNTSKNNWYYATHAEYTTFQPYWYSLDIILPIVDLKMENDWSVAIPSPDGSFFKTYNYFVRSLVWIESLIGWGLSLMLAAILSGLAKNEKE